MAHVVLAQEAKADRGVDIEAEDVSPAEDREAVALGAVGFESEPLPQVESLARRGLVEDEVEVTEGVDDQRPLMAIELADARDLVFEKLRVDPESLRTSPIEGLVLDLPGHQRRVVAIAEHGVGDE